MNRLRPPAVTLTQSSLQVQVDMDQLTRELDRGVPHSLFAPLHYEPNYAYPLLIWLHGPRADERQLQRIMPLLSIRNYVAIAPRGPVSGTSERGGYEWHDTPEWIGSAEQHVFEALRIATKRYNIAPHRIFLGGLEKGGTLAYRIAAQSPDRFAGVLSIGGEFPTASNVFSRLSELRRVPLFVAQGRDSEVYSEDRLCGDLRLMHSAGLSLTVRQYPCGDELNSQMLRDMDAWMMEIVTGTPSKPRPPVVPVIDHN